VRENSGHEYATMFIAAPLGLALALRLGEAIGFARGFFVVRLMTPTIPWAD